MAASSAPATAGRPRRPTEATRLLARTEGILVDPIYTAKALAGLIALARDGALDGRRSSSGTPAGRPACSSRSTPDPDMTKPPTDAGGFEGLPRSDHWTVIVPFISGWTSQMKPYVPAVSAGTA